MSRELILPIAIAAIAIYAGTFFGQRETTNPSNPSSLNPTTPRHDQPGSRTRGAGPSGGPCSLPAVVDASPKTTSFDPRNPIAILEPKIVAALQGSYVQTSEQKQTEEPSQTVTPVPDLSPEDLYWRMRRSRAFITQVEARVGLASLNGLVGDPTQARTKAALFRRLLFGRDCEILSIVAILRLCTRIRELAVTSRIFCELLHRPEDLPANLDLTVLPEQTTFQDDDLRQIPQAILNSTAEARGKVKKLAFLTNTPLQGPAWLPLNLFHNLSHLAVPVGSYLDLNNMTTILPGLKATVFLLPQGLQSTSQIDEILRKHVFMNRRIFLLDYLSDSKYEYRRDMLPPVNEQWKEAAKEPSFWKRAHIFTVDRARQMLRSLEFTPSSPLSQGPPSCPVLEECITCFKGRYAEMPLKRPGSHETFMPLSLVQQVSIHPALDAVVGVSGMLRCFPNVEKLALSCLRFDELFAPNVGLTRPFYSQRTIELMILDRPKDNWPSFGSTAHTQRVTHLVLWKGGNVAQRSVWAAFPRLVHVGLPQADVAMSVVKMAQAHCLTLRSMRIILPTSLFADSHGPEHFASWVKTLCPRAGNPLGLRISFYHEKFTKDRIWD